MRTVRILLLLFAGLALMQSCKKDEVKVNLSQDNLVGNWINPVYKDSLIILEKSESLKVNQYGICFKADGKLVERKNIGWCGTPPVSYSDYDGTWSKQDSTVTVNVGYWGGASVYKLIIFSLSENKLTVEQEY
jgi:hypothetical protein